MCVNGALLVDRDDRLTIYDARPAGVLIAILSVFVRNVIAIARSFADANYTPRSLLRAG